MYFSFLAFLTFPSNAEVRGRACGNVGWRDLVACVLWTDAGGAAPEVRPHETVTSVSRTRLVSWPWWSRPLYWAVCWRLFGKDVGDEAVVLAARDKSTASSHPTPRSWPRWENPQRRAEVRAQVPEHKYCEINKGVLFSSKFWGHLSCSDK